MPLHSVVITNPSGVLLLSRYWGGGAASWSTEGSQARAQWERSLWAAAAPWPTAAGQPKSPDSGMGVVDEFAMVWRQIGELVVFVAGDDEYDELILESEVFPLVEALLREHCGGKLVESTLLHYDTYGKVVLTFEEMLRQGHLLYTNVETVLRMSKLKKLDTKL
mmetsp:Transcript_35009/g.93854  ORF Transcript_35009/g.93854 Transcript_35009/m.93854 type:complete len:164 (-) Transcript_35009:109-600(-)